MISKNNAEEIVFVNEKRVSLTNDSIMEITHEYEDEQLSEAVKLWGYVPTFAIMDHWEEPFIASANANLKQDFNNKYFDFCTEGITKLDNGSIIYIEFQSPIFTLILVSPEYATYIIKMHEKDYLFDVLKIPEVYGDEPWKEDTKIWHFSWSGAKDSS